MKIKILLLTLFLLATILLFALPKSAKAKTSNNPVFATIAFVQQMISDALSPIQNSVSNLTGRVAALEVTVTPIPGEITNLQNQVTNLQNRVATLEALLTPSPSTVTSYIVSDATWKFSLTAPSGWLNASFDDSSWINAIAPSDGQCPVSAIWSSSLITENGTLPMSESTPNWTGQTGYFRKTFTLNFIPSKASMKTLIDDNGTIYINGNQVYSSLISPNAGIQTTTIDPSVFVQGKNVINVIDVDLGGCQGTQLELAITH